MEPQTSPTNDSAGIKYTTVDEYISQYSGDIRLVLEQARATIRAALPLPPVTEKLSWQMPTYAFQGNLIHFAAAKHHLGVYPGVEAVAAFVGELDGYEYAKGTIRFPYRKEIPWPLIARIAQFCYQQRLAEVEVKNAAKAKDKTHKNVQK